MKCQDTYKEVKTFNFPNAIVRVFIPDLTKEERDRRMKRLHDSAAELLRCKERVEAEERKKAQENADNADYATTFLREAG